MRSLPCAMKREFLLILLAALLTEGLAGLFPAGLQALEAGGREVLQVGALVGGDGSEPGHHQLTGEDQDDGYRSGSRSSRDRNIRTGNIYTV